MSMLHSVTQVNNRTNVYLSSTRTNNKHFYHYTL